MHAVPTFARRRRVPGGGAAHASVRAMPTLDPTRRPGPRPRRAARGGAAAIWRAIAATEAGLVRVLERRMRAGRAAKRRRQPDEAGAGAMRGARARSRARWPGRRGGRRGLRRGAGAAGWCARAARAGRWPRIWPPRAWMPDAGRQVLPADGDELAAAAGLCPAAADRPVPRRRGPDEARLRELGAPWPAPAFRATSPSARLRMDRGRGRGAGAAPLKQG